MPESEAYDVVWMDDTEDDLLALETKVADQITAKMARLAANVKVLPHEAMKGNWKGHYRIRVGDYRVIYAIHHEQRLIAVVKIGHRREVYDE